MDAYIVIGDANSFKSSTIRSLTGCRIRGVRDMMIGGVVVSTFVQLSSLQEGRNPINSRAFIKEVKASGAQAAIFPLRALQHRGRPDANLYIQDFLQARWTVKIAILHSPNFVLSALLPPRTYRRYPSGANPLYYSNRLASQVRRYFGWL